MEKKQEPGYWRGQPFKRKMMLMLERCVPVGAGDHLKGHLLPGPAAPHIHQSSPSPAQMPSLPHPGCRRRLRLADETLAGRREVAQLYRKHQWQLHYPGFDPCHSIKRTFQNVQRKPQRTEHLGLGQKVTTENHTQILKD